MIKLSTDIDLSDDFSSLKKKKKKKKKGSPFDMDAVEESLPVSVSGACFLIIFKKAKQKKICVSGNTFPKIRVGSYCRIIFYFSK